MPLDAGPVADCARKIELVGFRGKDLFDGEPEKRRNFKCERQTRVIFAFFDRVNGLPGDLQPICKICLRPIAIRPQYLEYIFHSLVRRNHRVITDRMYEIPMTNKTFAGWALVSTLACGRAP